MDKKATFLRYNLIIRRLRKCPAEFNEIREFLDYESEIRDYDLKVSKRTFQRDIKNIEEIFNILISYNHSQAKYFIESHDDDIAGKRLLEAFDTFNAMNISGKYSDLIHFEDRKPKGSEYIHDILKAINQHNKLEFVYGKFYKSKIEKRIVNPLALKEYRNRWYLVSKDNKDSIIKSFALDRIESLSQSRIKFKYPPDFNIKEYYKNCFGVIRPFKEDPKDIILSFSAFQGKYIKTLPLHHSQKILKDTKEELKIKLRLNITHDFIMEILSFGDNVTVEKPSSLQDQIFEAIKKTNTKYCDSRIDKLVEKLNKMLHKKNLERNDFENVFSKIMDYNNKNFIRYNFAYYSQDRLKEAKRKKINCVKNENFNYAAYYRDVEKECLKLQEIKEKYNIETSSFIYFNNEILYFDFDDALNDWIVRGILKE